MSSRNPLANLPPNLQHLAAILDAQPGPTQAALHYALALLMVESGTATLISTTPTEDGGLVCTFQTTAGDVFNLTKPPLTEAQGAAIQKIIHQTLNQAGDSP